jgi:very-short-patch-repair endonuclease
LRAPDFIRDRAREMRCAMTQPERSLWALLRRNDLGLHFRRQHPTGPYILDFYCVGASLAVEVDGPVHDDQQDRDERRTAWLAKQGIRVLRFTAAEVETQPAAVLAALARAAPPSQFRQALKRQAPLPSPASRLGRLQSTFDATRDPSPACGASSRAEGKIAPVERF